MTAYNFSQLIDFTRTSSGTFTDSTGKIASTPASKNLLTFTQEFDNAAWTKTDVAVSTNSTAAPDGTTSADTITEGIARTAFISQGVTTTGGVTYAASIFVKRGNTDWLRLVSSDGTNGYNLWINTATGALGGNSTTGSGVYVSSTITDAGNGWYRVTLTGSNPLTTNGIRVNSATANLSSTRVSGATYALWGAQLETGSTATTYTRNFGGRFPPRFDYDPITLAPKGLLIEEQRTNLMLRSAEFDNASWQKVAATVSANAASAPDGINSADAVVEDATNSVHTIFQDPAIAASTTYTWTVYAKRGAGSRNFYLQANLNGGTAGAGFAWFDLGTGVAAAPVALIAPFTGASSSMTPVGNGWYRCSFTFATNAGNTSVSCFTSIYNGARVYTGDGTSSIFIWGAQLEAGAFATSYIPTVASQVTRTADVATISAPNFSSWFNANEGAFIFSGDSAYGNGGFIGSTPTTGAILYGNNGAARTFNGTNFIGTANAATVNTRFVAALSYSLTGRSIVLNAGTVSTDANLIQQPTAITLGGAFGGGYLNGHIRSLAYYPTRLTNQQLQALTA